MESSCQRAHGPPGARHPVSMRVSCLIVAIFACVCGEIMSASDCYGRRANMMRVSLTGDTEWARVSEARHARLAPMRPNNSRFASGEYGRMFTPRSHSGTVSSCFARLEVNSPCQVDRCIFSKQSLASSWSNTKLTHFSAGAAQKNSSWLFHFERTQRASQKLATLAKLGQFLMFLPSCKHPVFTNKDTDVLSTQLLPAGRLRPGKSTRKQLSTRAGPQITHKLTPCTPSRRGAASCVSGNRRRRSQGPAFPPTGGKRPRCHCTLAQLQSQCNEVLLNAFSAEVCLNDLTRWRAHMLCASTGPSVRVWRHERSCGARCRAGYQSSE